MYEVLILLVLVNSGFTGYIWRTVRRGPKRKFLGKLLNDAQSYTDFVTKRHRATNHRRGSTVLRASLQVEILTLRHKLPRPNDARKICAPKRNDFVVKTGLKRLGKCISQEVTMKDLVQCR
jgi:hypothetical protein